MNQGGSYEGERTYLLLFGAYACDKHNVPIATNLASAEMSIMGLQRGDLDWREMLHTKPRY